MSIAEIIRQGIAHEESYELINKRLAAAGCEFRLSANGNSGWTDEEIAQGFDKAESKVKYLTLADLMGRNNDLAGKTVNFWCKEGNYDITYNEDGYAVKAVRKEA